MSSTAVASAIGSKNEELQQYNAAKAELYYANSSELKYAGYDATMFNNDGAHKVDCDTSPYSGLVSMFDYFIDNGVRVFNESYHCGDPVSWGRDRIRDYYTRYYDITLVRSAGNYDGATICTGFNSLCVGASELGSNYVSPISRWENRSGRDREEPDIVAPGDASTFKQIEYLAGKYDSFCNSTSPAFHSYAGTSFSSPAVAGMLALAYEQVEGGYQRCRMSEWSRAITKASAIGFASHRLRVGSSPNPTARLARHDLAINSSGTDEDESHGAGRPQFNRMLGWTCPENAGSPDDDCSLITEEDLVNIEGSTSDLSPLPRIHHDSDINHPNDGGESQMEMGLSFTSNVQSELVHYGGNCGLVRSPDYDNLSCDIDYSDGVWLSRFVLEWSSCPGAIPNNPENTSKTSEIRPATDFNLSIKTPSDEQFWVSTSFDDTSESFEFCHTEEGDYTISVIPTTLENYGCVSPSDPSKRGERAYILEQRVRVDEEDCPELEDYFRQ